MLPSDLLRALRRFSCQLCSESHCTSALLQQFITQGRQKAFGEVRSNEIGAHGRLLRGPQVEQRPYYQKITLTWGWQGMLVTGIVPGALLSALLSGDFHWQWVPDLWASDFGSNPLLRVIVVLLGGITLGFGARWSDGCTSGHGISGPKGISVSSPFRSSSRSTTGLLDPSSRIDYAAAVLAGKRRIITCLANEYPFCGCMSVIPPSRQSSPK